MKWHAMMIYDLARECVCALHPTTFFMHVGGVRVNESCAYIADLAAFRGTFR